MDWLIADYESFFFGIGIGVWVSALVGWLVIGRLQQAVKQLEHDYERLNSDD